MRWFTAIYSTDSSARALAVFVSAAAHVFGGAALAWWTLRPIATDARVHVGGGIQSAPIAIQRPSYDPPPLTLEAPSPAMLVTPDWAEVEDRRVEATPPAGVTLEELIAEPPVVERGRPSRGAPQPLRQARRAVLGSLARVVRPGEQPPREFTTPRPTELHRPSNRQTPAAAANAAAGPRTPPRLDRLRFDNPPPVYPLPAKQRRLEGVVTLRLHIDAEGLVSKVDVIESSGYAIFDGAAVAATGRWRFIPATSGGRRVADTVKQKIIFRLPR